MIARIAPLRKVNRIDVRRAHRAATAIVLYRLSALRARSPEAIALDDPGKVTTITRRPVTLPQFEEDC